MPASRLGHRPLLPFTCQALHGYLGYDSDILGRIHAETLNEGTRSHLAIRYDNSDLHGTWVPSQLPPGQALREPQPLFRRLEESVADEEVERMMSASGDN